MSEIGKEYAALTNDDMGLPKHFKGKIIDGVYYPTPEEEEEMHQGWRLAQLAGYTVEELEAELDSRITGTKDVRER